MYHYSARQALMEANQQQLLTSAARARTLRELRELRRSERRAARRTKDRSERSRPVVAVTCAAPADNPA